MPPNDDLNTGLRQTHEAHELEIKRSIESFGAVEERFKEVVDAAETDQDPMEELEGLGRAIEDHGGRLEALIQTFDDLKRTLQQDDITEERYRELIEKARRRARQEPTPNGDPDDESA